MERAFGIFRMNDDRSQTNRKFVHQELSSSYWAEQIPESTVNRAIDHSICFNVFSENEQVAFARVISDHATFAYLCDVIVTEKFRGHGIGKNLMQFILDHPDLQGLRRFTLATKDAHSLYAQFGFHAPKFPDRLMEIHRPEVYKR